MEYLLNGDGNKREHSLNMIGMVARLSDCHQAAFLGSYVVGASARWWRRIDIWALLGRRQLHLGVASAAGAGRWRVGGAFGMRMATSGRWRWRPAVGGGGRT